MQKFSSSIVEHVVVSRMVSGLPSVRLDCICFASTDDDLSVTSPDKNERSGQLSQRLSASHGPTIVNFFD
jgi:hypothetical protein